MKIDNLKTIQRDLENIFTLAATAENLFYCTFRGVERYFQIE